uniref:Putative restriction endonuclease domain-containing protein n=1 Tax=Rhodopseudomonas palustris (strain DX-1) TaxID=652103 RepID=E6VGY6_RHOPX
MKTLPVTKVSAEQFLAWVAGQEQRYELVEGEIVAMAGAGRRHDAIIVNLTAAIHGQVRGGPCQTFTGDTYVATTPSTRRMPDLGVDCGQPVEESLVADQPVLVVEVLSPTTSGFDVTVKLAEYQSLVCLEYILLIDTEMASAHLYTRGEDRQWSNEVLKGLGAEFELPKLRVRLSLAEVYDGLQFRERPRLVAQDSSLSE